jgi:oligogalacturonide lyase
MGGGWPGKSARFNDRKICMPYYCNHYHANPDNAVLVGDDADDLVLIDVSGEWAKIEILCYHGTLWHTQTAHCHPTWSWDGSRILYASDRAAGSICTSSSRRGREA